VIAIENVRLFTELREALEQQTATAEILGVISQSPTDVDPVLTAVAKAMLRFCGGTDAIIGLRDGENWLIAGHEGILPASIGMRVPLNRETSPGAGMSSSSRHEAAGRRHRRRGESLECPPLEARSLPWAAAILTG